MQRIWLVLLRARNNWETNVAWRAPRVTSRTPIKKLKFQLDYDQKHLILKLMVELHRILYSFVSSNSITTNHESQKAKTVALS